MVGMNADTMAAVQRSWSTARVHPLVHAQTTAAYDCLAAERECREKHRPLEMSMRDLAEAQVHATLALAAATLVAAEHQ